MVNVCVYACLSLLLHDIFGCPTNKLVVLFSLDCFPLYLYNSPQHPHRQEYYILQYHNNKLAVYLSLSTERKWTWHITQLRRFSYDAKMPSIEIETGRFVTNIYNICESYIAMDNSLFPHDIYISTHNLHIFDNTHNKY